MFGKSIRFLLAGAVLCHANPEADRLTDAGIAEFSSAYRVWDGARFANAAASFRQAGEKDPSSATIAYWRGVALFHQMLQLQSVKSTQSAVVAMDGAVDALESAVQLAPDHAECHALLGTLYGMKIEGSMIRAIRYGPKVQSHQKLALKHGAQNPRVLYLSGASQFHIARDESSRREALKSLLAAEKLFQSESARAAGKFDPRWGYSSCLTFIARTYESLGNVTAAETYFRRALELHPADHVARDGLNRVK